MHLASKNVYDKKIKRLERKIGIMGQKEEGEDCIIMGFQPEYGQLLVREFSCEDDMPYYCFVTRGNKDNTVKVADEKAGEVLGVSVPAAESFPNIT